MTVSEGVRATSMGQFSREATGTAGGGIGRYDRPVDIAADHQDWLDEQPATVGCIHCPEFTFTGRAIDARAAAAAHREQLHPELVGKHTRRKPGAGALKRAKSDAEVAQIEAAKKARAEQKAADLEERLERTRRRLVGLEETSPDLSIPTDESPTDGGGVSSSSTSQTTEEETMGNAPAASTRQAILELLDGREVATKDIAAELGKSYAAVNTRIMGLLGEGLVTRVRRGVYTTSSTTTQVRPDPAPEPELEPEEPKPSVELEPAARIAPPGHPSPLVRLLSQLSTEDLELAVDEIEQMRRRLDAEHALIATALEEHEQAA